MEKVSMIMPCYNDGRYIEESIASALGQTYPDIELIIIDDGSDDPLTLQILEQISDPRIRVLHASHLRPAAARNRGIREASGKYILPLDADDLIDPCYIEKAVRYMEADASVGIVYCYADLFDQGAGRWYLPEYCLETMLQDNIIFVTALFRKADWELAGGFDESMKHGMEDYDFWLSILELDRSVIQIPEVLFHYRIKKVSRTSSFMDNPQAVKDTYRYIQLKHRALYIKYIDLFGVIMRDTLIEQKFEIDALRKGFLLFRLMQRFPKLKAIVKKIFFAG